MKSINFENIDELKAELENNTVILYGASATGESILKVLSQHSIAVDYFCDDDYNKWDTSFCGIPVISFDRLGKINDGKNVAVIISSCFAGPILGKLSKINVTVYEPFQIILEDQYFNKVFYKAQSQLSENEKVDFCKKVKIISSGMEDSESVTILSKFTDVIKSSDKISYSHFVDVASQEDHYFIKEVLGALPKHPVIIDGGGYTGDLIGVLKSHDIEFDKVYSFEMNPHLLKIMKENVEKNGLENRFIPVNKGLWNTSERVYLQLAGVNIAGGHIGNSDEGLLVDTVSIDEFFQDIHYDFIKMDIEGAELNALKGGALTIKANRPIMAISIYHSVDDFVNIPLYLFATLDNYSYFIRHHSFLDSETVLYCIPDERITP